MTTEAVASLRHEFPALGLVVSFIPVRKRALIADILLLWLEIRRALLSDEVMVSAIRLAWWRDMIKTGEGQAPPLAERLSGHLSYGRLDRDSIVSMLTELTDQTASNASLELISSLIHRGTGEVLAKALGEGRALVEDVEAAQTALKTLDDALAGREQAFPTHRRLRRAPLIVRLVFWLADTPSYLDYPHKHPLLGAKMLWAVAIRRV